MVRMTKVTEMSLIRMRMVFNASSDYDNDNSVSDDSVSDKDDEDCVRVV